MMTLRRFISIIINATIISAVTFGYTTLLKPTSFDNDESSYHPYRGEMHITMGVDPMSINRVAQGEYLLKLPEGLSGQARVNKSYGDVIELPMSEALYKQFGDDSSEPDELSFTFKGVKESSYQPNDIRWLITDGKTQICFINFNQRHNAEGDLVFYREEGLPTLFRNCARYLIIFLSVFLFLLGVDYLAERIFHRKKQR